ncbi:unnamed protein product (macronuclear) [Paramecium tetraurelia]|uniref:Alpha/beta hydrolase fold-3 domain-containing protein n=1 Tax=Paramecium tetraurelia TaxID=5888 RepID=A0D9G0_PARTE|nr:uncharacterized protein GSPATT00014607001 [Paramecium tetraurelia]CAK79677.1 unnamed protein product [Paramecium tetraurelia]|eukprot:XP_001447074.1 hypothetical protein (macronuclear) [Paramecium tetraurelia strain d4-2]
MQIKEPNDIQDNVDQQHLIAEQDQSGIFIEPNHQINILARNTVDKLQANIQSSISKINQLLMKAQDIIMNNSQNQDLCQKAVQLVQVASIGLMQIININELLENKALAVEQNVSSLNITCTRNQLNEYTTNLVLDYMNHIILENILKLMDNFLELEKEQKRNLAIYLAKLQSCIEILPGATRVQHNDLFAIPPDHQEWQLINPFIEKKQLASDEQIKKSYDQVSFGILLGNAMISKGSEYNGELMKTFMEGFGVLYYGLNKKKMKSRADHFLVEAKKEDAFKAWNLPETGIIKKFLPAIFPSISFNKKIYIPKFFRKINKEYILEQYKQGTINKINNDCGIFYPDQMISIDDLQKDDINQERVQVRILCHEDLKFKGVDGFMSLFKSTKNKDLNFDKIVIHIHGGGFVAMSSRSHQTYTRKWANNMKVPIFSIDYKMAPDHPYPEGLDDCWQAYMFIITFIQKFFNIIPSKVVLVGDSAGGNLVAALTIQAIKAGVRVPDGILLAYPALSLNMKSFTPSFLVSLDDFLLHHTVLKLCLNSYVQKEFDSQVDPMLSPSMASDEILRQFPKTRIAVGTYDPLHDESFRLLQKLVQLKKDVKLIEYQSMPHGFLSFDIINGMKEAKQTVIDAQNYLLEMLN